MTDSPLIVALDHDDPAAARACVQALAGRVGRFKVGSALFTRSGPSFVAALVGEGRRVFLDLKYHDTPATVAGAVAAAADLGVDLLTLHAAGGPAMLAAARRAADEIRGSGGAAGGSAGRRPRLLAVTVLTSLGPEDYARVAGPGARPLAEAVSALARMALDEGLDGVVCAAAEAAGLRASLGSVPLLVVPGIRPAWSEAGHGGQARRATPAGALRAGATYIVVGRAITQATDPTAAADRIAAEIATPGESGA
ncbi:MAG TPA: orotidine-5'-phosphate decarboxylase [Gemmatimonadota bacterium]|nr:orotidine-5'-phosphate decarboxylase [Gemmatimonadota bacterium]